jgi:hypothetical protein
MLVKRTGLLVELLEERRLFSLPFGMAMSQPLTLNPSHSDVLVNIASGPLLTNDFNGDGNSDLVFGGRGGSDSDGPHYVGVMLGSASGEFSDAGTLVAPGNATLSAYATGDFNGDGKQDLAAVYATESDGIFSYGLVVGLGNGSGGFTTQTLPAFTSTSFIPSGDTLAPASIAVGKFSGQKDQLAIAIPTPANEDVDLFGYDGNNQLTFFSESAVTGFSGSNDQIVAGHFHSSTQVDLAIYDPIASQVELLTFDTDSFEGSNSVSIRPAASSPASSTIAAGDLNSDGMTDLVVLQTASGDNQYELDVLLNTGSDSVTELPAVTDYNPDDTAAADWVTVGDFENTGEDEVATRFGVYRSDFAGKLQYSGIDTIDTASPYAVAGDFNGDGALDLVAVSGTGSDATAIQELLGEELSPLASSTVQVQDEGQKNSLGDITAKFTATVSGSGAAPTGTVDFYAESETTDAVVDLGTQTLANGTATISPTNMPAGKQDVFAVYSGDTVYSDATSDALPVTYVSISGGGVDTGIESEIIKSNLPTSVVTGVKLAGKSVTVAIKNSTGKLYDQLTAVGVYPTTDGTIDPSFPALGETFIKMLRIPSSKSVNVVVPIKEFYNGLSGQYALVAEVYGNEMPISTTTGPVPFVTLGPPVVSIAPVIVSTTLNRDDTSTTIVKVTNNGNIPSVGPSQILLYGSNDTTVTNATLLLKQKVPALKPGVPFVVRLIANKFNTQLGLLKANFVVEVIDPSGNALTTSTPVPGGTGTG